MGKHIRKSTRSKRASYKGARRYEHWYVDNQVYFITARVRDQIHAFGSDEAKQIFWDRFHHWTRHYGFTPWITSLLSNHYHTLGYLKAGANLGPLIQRLHGSVAKLTNDLLPERIARFWLRDGDGKEYFDGCIRSEKQARRTFEYIRTQCRRHRVCAAPHEYPHTVINVSLERAVRRAHEIGAFLSGVPYRRLGD